MIKNMSNVFYLPEAMTLDRSSSFLPDTGSPFSFAITFNSFNVNDSKLTTDFSSLSVFSLKLYTFLGVSILGFAPFSLRISSTSSSKPFLLLAFL